MRWWDAVDVISSSGYYPADDWEDQLDRIEAVVRKHGKPFLFLEAGCPSRTGSERIPNDWSWPGEANEEAQRLFYERMFEACDRRDWVGGFMLWDWPAALYPEETASANRDYCPYGKRAEAVIREYFRLKTDANQAT